MCMGVYGGELPEELTRGSLQPRHLDPIVGKPWPEGLTKRGACLGALRGSGEDAWAPHLMLALAATHGSLDEVKLARVAPVCKRFVRKLDSQPRVRLVDGHLEDIMVCDIWEKWGVRNMGEMGAVRLTHE